MKKPIVSNKFFAVVIVSVLAMGCLFEFISSGLSNSTVETKCSIPVEDFPWDLAVRNGYAYVSMQGSESVLIIRISDMAVLDKVLIERKLKP